MSEVAGFLLGEARLTHAGVESDSSEGEDSFGNPGTVTIERQVAEAVCELGPDEIARAYLERGFTELPRDSHTGDDQVRLKLDRLDPSDPFLWENDVEVAVGGRDLSDVQRRALGMKVEALRAELSAKRLKTKRRAEIEAMLDQLSAGLLTRITVEVGRRTFTPAPLLEEDAVLGTVLPLSRLSQLVYTVVPLDPADREEGEGAPMYLTVLGVGPAQATFLFSGGIAGKRTVTDLDQGFAHHAWFQNRQVVATEDTAPWVSRRVYADLTEVGGSSLIVRWGREDEPIPLRRTGEESLALRVDGAGRSVPVLVAESEKEDRLWILADPLSPLVLRMEERGAELLRTVGEVRRLTTG